jgi:MoxR-like ATPase
MSATDDWKLFRGPQALDPAAPATAAAPRREFPAPPPWRDFTKKGHRAITYRPGPQEIEMVNAALYLRRPLLITGKPGTGKSSLIYAVAEELGLGKVLEWPISSRSTVRDGLYQYDALGRLRDANLHRSRGVKETEDVVLGRYLSLGPLGTALLPSERPQALLIDEIDKADVDLPNDLLHTFENGNFEIPEARRLMKDFKTVRVRRSGADDGEEDVLVTIEDGRVQCTTFPFVVITSNGERDLPPAFLRRCLRLTIDAPDKTQLERIVNAHFPEAATGDLAREIDALIKSVAAINQDKERVIATDQLLSAIHLIRGLRAPQDAERKSIVDRLLRELGQGQ